MPNKKSAVLSLCLFILVFVGSVYAEEKLGIPVYPGASQDVDTTKFLQEGLKVNGAAYRTNDDAAKVIDFYKGQKDLRVISSEKEGAIFKKGDKTNVTIQNPWMDMKTSKMMSDTLISIVSEK